MKRHGDKTDYELLLSVSEDVFSEYKGEFPRGGGRRGVFDRYFQVPTSEFFSFETHLYSAGRGLVGE